MPVNGESKENNIWSDNPRWEGVSCPYTMGRGKRPDKPSQTLDGLEAKKGHSVFFVVGKLLHRQDASTRVASASQ